MSSSEQVGTVSYRDAVTAGAFAVVAALLHPDEAGRRSGCKLLLDLAHWFTTVVVTLR